MFAAVGLCQGKDWQPSDELLQKRERLVSAASTMRQVNALRGIFTTDDDSHRAGVVPTVAAVDVPAASSPTWPTSTRVETAGGAAAGLGAVSAAVPAAMAPAAAAVAASKLDGRGTVGLTTVGPTHGGPAPMEPFMELNGQFP